MYRQSKAYLNFLPIDTQCLHRRSTEQHLLEIYPSICSVFITAWVGGHFHTAPQNMSLIVPSFSIDYMFVRVVRSLVGVGVDEKLFGVFRRPFARLLIRLGLLPAPLCVVFNKKSIRIFLEKKTLLMI